MFEKIISSSSIEEIPIYSDEMSALNKRRTCLFTCFLLKHGYQSDEEEIVYNNLSKIIADISENNVRLLLAQEACMAEQFPEELAIKLAYDKYEISEHIISHYQRFSDAQILRMIEDFHDEARILLIANRANINFVITDKLINLSKANITKAVLENTTAKISIKSLQVVLSRHQHNKEFLDAIYSRKDLSKNQIIELLGTADSPIKQNMIDNYWGENITNSPFSKLNIINLTESQIRKNDQYHTLSSNISRIFRLNQLNWHVLLSYLVKGDLFSFIYGIATLSNMPFAKVKEIVLNDHRSRELIDLLTTLKVQLDYIEPLQTLLCEIAKELKKGELTPENYRSKITLIIDEYKLERLEYLKKLLNT